MCVCVCVCVCVSTYPRSPHFPVGTHASGVKVRTRDSPAPSDPKKSNDPGRKRVSTSSLPWITVHNVTKDQIDSTPVSLKKLGQAGNHNSYVSDDVNVILADVPSSTPVVPPTSADGQSLNVHIIRTCVHMYCTYGSM